MNNPITIETLVNAPAERVWSYWNNPEHVMQWNSASPDWHSPAAVNDLREGGNFRYRMEARDGSMGFDFEGTYTEVRPHSGLAYSLGDGRKVRVEFIPVLEGTRIREQFEPESQNTVEMQQAGWQAILDNFATYAGRQS